MNYNDNSNWYVSAESGAEPVTLDELKAHLNLSFSGSASFDDDDDYLTTLITYVRDFVERYCGISVKAKTIVAELRNECGGVDLPCWPVYSIISSVDRDNVAVTLSITGDKFKTIDGPASDYIKVTYYAGYMKFGASYVPKAIKQAILEECAYRYTNRGLSEGIMSDSGKMLLSSFKKKSWLA